MFKVSSQVKTSRIVYAGLSENGPKICDQGTSGIILEIENREPDGIHVKLNTGLKWWFKPNQLETQHE